MQPPVHFTENALLKNTHQNDKDQIVEKFPELSSCAHGFYLSLRKYLYNSPQKYFDTNVYTKFLRWLNNRHNASPAAFTAYLQEQYFILNQAFLFLEELNKLDIHEFIVGLDDYNYLGFIDQKIHPVYLRLVEAVFSPFVKIIAYFSRVDRNAGTEGLNIWSIVQEISSTQLSNIVSHYNHVVRNAIAHGGITYLQREIKYQDKNGKTLTLQFRDVVRLMDNLLDTCNALACAYKVFFIAQYSDMTNIPHQVLLEELVEETNAPWWTINSFVPTELREGRQLLIYILPQTNDIGKVRLSCFQTAILCEFLYPGFIRYFLSLHSNKTGVGWAIFDGKILQKNRLKINCAPTDYQESLIDGFVFFIPKIKLPKVFWKWYNLLLAYRIHWPLYKQQINNKLNRINITARHTKIHRTSWGSVLNASIFLELNGQIEDNLLVKENCNKIIKRAHKKAKASLSHIDIVRYLPLAFARIAVFSRDHRERRLDGFGLGSDLICTIQLRRNKKINPPDIFQSTIEFHKRYKIAWNKAWLELISS